MLVTGGAGFIGSHLVDFLVSQKLGQIVVIDNLKRGRLANLAQSIDRIEFIDGDIRNRELIECATRGIDIVFHLAAQSNVLGAVEDVDYSFTSNVAGTLEVLRAAKQSGVRRMVFTSSREVYGEPAALPVPETAPIAPKNAYGASKAAAEMYCRVLASGGLTVSVVRLANVYGSRDFDRVIPIFLERALRNEPLKIYGGRQILDFVWIDTVVQALLTASDMLEFPGPINVGCGKPTTILELATKIVTMTGSRSEISVEPQRAVEVSRFVASTEQMQRMLGIIPEANLLHLARLVNAYAEHSLTQSKARGVGN
jgi:UDP-glucose 4-epimerase